MVKQEMNSEREEIEVHEQYFGEIAASAKNPILKSLLHFIFDSRVPERRIDLGLFSISFRGTEMQWYTNFLNQIYVRLHRTIPYFYTGHGDQLFAYAVYGRDEAKSFYNIPEEKAEFFNTRTAEWQRQGQSFTIDPASLKEEETGGTFSVGYEGDWKKSDKDFHIYERITFVGVDKVVIKAIIPLESDKKIRSDVMKIANSTFIKPPLLHRRHK